MAPTEFAQAVWQNAAEALPRWAPLLKDKKSYNYKHEAWPIKIICIRHYKKI